jgi:hypothetical protein
VQEHATQKTAMGEMADQEMADRELTVQFESNLCQQFVADHGGLLLTCKETSSACVLASLRRAWL